MKSLFGINLRRKDSTAVTPPERKPSNPLTAPSDLLPILPPALVAPSITITTTTTSSPSPSDMIHFISLHLDRPLDPVEKRMLRLLSPQGVAKINRDVLNGISMNQTLYDLKAVFERMGKRRQSIESQLSDEARMMIAKMGRPPTTDELALFTSVPMRQITADIRRHSKRGEPLEMAIEDLAMRCKYEQLASDAAAFSKTESLPTRLLLLTPTARPATPNAMAPNMAHLKSKTALVGISPISLWFYDALETIEADEAEEQKVLPRDEHDHSDGSSSAGQSDEAESSTHNLRDSLASSVETTPRSSQSTLEQMPASASSTSMDELTHSTHLTLRGRTRRASTTTTCTDPTQEASRIVAAVLAATCAARMAQSPISPTTKFLVAPPSTKPSSGEPTPRRQQHLHAHFAVTNSQIHQQHQQLLRKLSATSPPVLPPAPPANNPSTTAVVANPTNPKVLPKVARPGLLSSLTTALVPHPPPAPTAPVSPTTSNVSQAPKRQSLPILPRPSQPPIISPSMVPQPKRFSVP